MNANADGETKVVAETLRGPLVHEGWQRRYRGAHPGHYKRLFDMVAGYLGDPATGPILDAGCGPAVHALELARRGYTVHGVDSSPSAVEMAHVNIDAAGLGDKVTIRQGDLLDLFIDNGSYGRTICWGVLMHVPRVEKAIEELVRVTAAGGVILVTENNLHSLQGRVMGIVKKKDRTTVRVSRKPAGLEVWKRTDAGELLARLADPSWVEAEFRRHGAAMVARRPTSLTNVHTRLKGRAGAVVRAISEGFFFIRRPGPALGNVFVFEKRLPS